MSLPRRDPTDTFWICNATDNCTAPATLQAAVACASGCVNAATRVRHTIDEKSTALTALSAQLSGLVIDAQHKVQAGEPVTDLERAALAQAMQQVADTDSEITRLRADANRLEAEHSHPMMACDAHASVLPQPESADE